MTCEPSPVKLSAGVASAPNLTPPPGNPRFPLFDSLRALAALSVFAGHTVTGTYSLTVHPHLFVWATQVAYQGVAMFFLISGFLLYRPFLVARRGGHPIVLRDFARRRVLRIVPAYWVALTLFILAGFVSGVTAGNWWIFYGFGQIYSATRLGQGIGVAWTLCIEVTFYAALPVFALAAARLSRRPQSVRGDVALLIVLSAASLVFRADHSSIFQTATVSTLPGTFLWFALGMGLAVLSVTSEQAPSTSPALRWLKARPTLAWVAAGALFVVLHQIAISAGSLGLVRAQLATHVLYGLIALLVLLPAVFDDHAGGLARRVLRLPALAWVGLISYAFYLYHTIVIAQLNKIVGDGHLSPRYLIVTAAALPISCACAAASYYLVERPILRIRRRTPAVLAG